MKAKITVFLLAFIAFSSIIYSQGSAVKEIYNVEKKQSTDGSGTAETLVFPYVPGQYYEEGFEGESFPPQGWQAVDVLGGIESWGYNTYQPYGGLRAAKIYSERYKGSMGEGSDWLITPQITVSSGDSLKFYIMCYYSYGIGSLAVLVTEDESFATDGASLDNSFADTLIFQDLQTAANQTWDPYKASLEKYAGKKIYIGFKVYNEGGSYLNIDNIQIGTKPAFDIEARRIDIKEVYKAGETISLFGIFTNVGTQKLKSLDMNLEILETGKKYSQHYDYESAHYTPFFSSWNLTNADAGKYTAKMYLSAAGDQNISNDTLYQTFRVIKNADGMSWHSETPMSNVNQRLSAAAYTSPSGSGAPDTTFIYAISGLRDNNSLLDIQKYNTITRIWETDTTLPGAATDSRAFQVNGKIYILPGTNVVSGGTYYTQKLYIYDIKADTIGVGADFPYAYAWYAAGLYGDSLIYAIGGDNQVHYRNTLLIYNINEDKWTEGTPPFNDGRGALNGTICGDKIIIAGGTTNDARLSDVNIGTINPANPFDITWENEVYPGGALEDITAGSWYSQTKKYAFFTGGHSNYGGNISPTSWAYDLEKKEWLGLPNKNTVSIYSSEMVPVVRNDSVFMAVLGGWNSTPANLNVNEWLYVCPTDEGMLKKDAAAFSIDFDTVAVNVSMVPKATFKNVRLPEVSFDVTMEITPGDYKSTKSVGALAFDAEKQVEFEPWIPAAELEYTVKIYITLADDADKNNDTLTSEVQVVSDNISLEHIFISKAVGVNRTIAPRVYIYNTKENMVESFTVTLKINPGEYICEKTATNLEGWTSTMVEFDSWTPSDIGEYTILAYATLETDADKYNDTINLTVKALEGLETSEWLVDEGPFNSMETRAVYYTKKAASETELDSGFIFMVSTKGSSGPKKAAAMIADSSYIFNIYSGEWIEAPTLPSNLDHYEAAYAAGKVYVPGGLYETFEEYGTSEKLYVYDIDSNKWSLETPMPKAAAGYSIGVYGDSLIYVIGGVYDGPDTTILYNGVQIYNVYDKTWKDGTEYSDGFPVEMSGTILKNKIVLTGGQIMDFKDRRNTIKDKSSEEAIAMKRDLSDEVYIGVIDPADPYSISWTMKTNPTGESQKSASSAYETKDGGFVLFAGGENYSSEFYSGVSAYDPFNDKWFIAPDLLVPVESADGVTAVRNDSVYFAVIGGYNYDYEDGLIQWVFLGMVQDTGVGVIDKENMPLTFSLSQNYPNPFNPSTVIKYSVAEAGQVELKVYNILGQEVITLVNEFMKAGQHEVKFNAGALNLSSGVYLYRIKSGSFVQTKKLMLIK